MPTELLPTWADTSHALSQGWMLMAGLIVALGAQNAWVLRKGLRREQVGAVVATCVIADVALTCAGVFGLGAAVTRSPVLLEAVRVGGVAFLLLYAGRAAWRAVRGADEALAAAGPVVASPVRAVSATLAVTLLNPHVYLDTVLLVGAVGAAQAAELRPAFALGAALASLMWFVLLGYGARALAPTLQRPLAWRLIDACVAGVMGMVALRLWFDPL